MDPLAGSRWSAPETVAGFVQSAPNQTLLRFAGEERRRSTTHRLLDLGCGAARNALPLTQSGWNVLGLDLSLPMLHAARRRALDAAVEARLHVALAPMDCLPVRARVCDLIVAHGIWNLARSGAEFRAALREASRVARQGAGLFVFTFSRSTLAAEARPMAGECFVFTQFSGSPQCFLTEDQLLSELAAVGFEPDLSVPLTEHNRPQPNALCSGGPVIYEGAFRFRDVSE